MTEHNLFAVVQDQLDECAKIMKLEPDAHAILRVPMREIWISLAVRMDDGSLKYFRDSEFSTMMLEDQQMEGFDSILMRRLILLKH